MSNGNLNTSNRSSARVRNEENKHELTQLSASVTIEAEAEPQKFRSRLRIIAVLTGLNVSSAHNKTLFLQYEDQLTEIRVKLSMFTSALDQTIIATAVPTITSKLNALYKSCLNRRMIQQ
jgi:hypothetical protein